MSFRTFTARDEEQQIKELCDRLEGLLSRQEIRFVREPTDSGGDLCRDIYAAVLAARRLLARAKAPEVTETATSAETEAEQAEINWRTSNRLHRLESITGAHNLRIVDLEKKAGLK